MQEWKDLLLRGFEDPALQKYGDAFHRQEKSVAAMAAELRTMVTDPEALAVIDEFAAQHRTMGEKYDAALKVFQEGKGENPRAADAMVKDQDRAPTDLIDKLVTLLANRAEIHFRAMRNESVWVALVIVLLLAASVTVSAFVMRRINALLARSVTALTAGTEQVYSAATQVSSASQSLARATSENAASLEETSASTEAGHCRDAPKRGGRPGVLEADGSSAGDWQRPTGGCGAACANDRCDQLLQPGDIQDPE